MYPEHVKNYPVWQERLGAHLKGLSPYWLDLQAAQVTDSTLRSLYTTAAFQVTGSVFAQYLTHIMPDIPDRKNDPLWRSLVAKFPK